MTTEFVNIKKIFEDFNKGAAKWRRERIIGDIKHDVKNKYISIKVPGTKNEYDIEINRIDTPQAAFHWLCHMTEKNWFTPQMTYDFIKVIKRVTTVNEYCVPHIWEKYNTKEAK